MNWEGDEEVREGDEKVREGDEEVMEGDNSWLGLGRLDT